MVGYCTLLAQFREYLNAAVLQIESLLVHPQASVCICGHFHKTYALLHSKLTLEHF